jgi:hypothetical protein
MLIKIINKSRHQVINNVYNEIRRLVYPYIFVQKKECVIKINDLEIRNQISMTLKKLYFQ